MFLSNLDSSGLDSFLRSTIHESVERHHYPLSKDGQAYLGGVLKRFAASSELFEDYLFHGEKIHGLKPVTLQHFDSLEKKGSEKEAVLQNLAEQCLLLVGYFYDHIRKNGLAQVHFHSNMGMAAYGGISPASPSVFPEIAEHFDLYSVVVGDLHVPELRQHARELEKVMKRWMQTRDRRYELLIEGALGENNLLVGKDSGEIN
ncbi:hypothetical protein J4210_04940 [Candidatus Woesearchaeota archaeon]|nr:hypothetical protein [Candidatus Woesearchaeota archaeon]